MATKESDYKGYNKIKRSYPLTEWDVSFLINGDVLGRFLNFLEDIHPDLPLLFYRDRIIIRQRSSDNISFANINIEIIDSMKYDPGLGEHPSETDHKLAIMDATGLAGELADYAKGSDMITVRIDTRRLKKCEFTCGEYRKHKVLLVEPENFSKLDITEKKIRDNRNNPLTKGAELIIEPETFMKICAIGGKKGGVEMIFEVTRKGLLVYTSDEDSGTSFEMLYEPNSIYGTGNIGGAGDVQEITGEFEYTGEDEEEDDMDSGIDSGIDNDYNDSIDNNSEIGSTNDDISEDKKNETGVDEWNMPVPHSDIDTNVKKSSKKKEKKDEKPKEKKEKPTDTIVSKSKFDHFSMPERIEKISVIEKKEFLTPINKLKAQSPILMELRNNAPLIVEQNSPGMWCATLTIAPIVPENE